MEIINIHAHRYQTAQINEFAAAFVKFQAEITDVEIVKDAKKKVKNKKTGKDRPLHYASFHSIIKCTKPVLAKHGLTVIQGQTGELIETIILHESGQLIGLLMPFAAMENSFNSNLQNIGGGISFLSRYAYKSALGLSIDEESDDTKEKQQSINTKTAIEFLNKNGFKVEKDAEKIEFDPTKNPELIEKCALQYLADGTLARVQFKYNIAEKYLLSIYSLADKLKSESDAELDKENESIVAELEKTTT